MNNVQELRETLRSHAEIEDRAGAGRAAAVHERVHVVRRRRRAVVGGVAVAALAAVAVGLTLPGSGDKAEPAGAAGLDAPATIESTGYTYRLDRTEQGDGSVSIKVPATDQPVLVAWGTEDGAADPVRVKVSLQEAFTSVDDAFEDFYVVEPGRARSVRVTGADGDVELAAYTLTDAVPEGVTKDGITYRSLVGSRRLAGATIGDLGQTELELQVEAPAGPVTMSTLCTGLGRGYQVNHSFGDGDVVSSGGCGDRTTFDPGATWNTGVPELADTVGEPVTMRLWISRRGDDTPVEPSAETARARLGLGVYGEDPEFGGASDAGASARIEFRGHTWAITGENAATGSGALTVGLDGAGPHLAVLSFARGGNVSFTYRVVEDGRRRVLGQSARHESALGWTSGPILVPAGADAFEAVPSAGIGDDLETTVAIYERVD